MPLVAVAGSDRIESWSLPSEQWIDLKATYRTIGLTMVCGQPGVPKTSVNGLPFFAHKPGANCGAHDGGPESPQHLLTKRVVAEAARALGWTATVENPGPDRKWIADVLLADGDRKLVVEAQWAAQSDAELRFRHERYAADGLACLWLLGPKNHSRASAVTSHLIREGIDALAISLPVGNAGAPDYIDLTDGITHILRGDFAPAAEVIATELWVDVTMVKCWRENCAKWMSRWYVSSASWRSRCGQTDTVSQRGYVPFSTSRVETVVEGDVRKQLAAIDTPAPTLYDFRRTRPVPEGYIAQICPHCRTVQGDAYSVGRASDVEHRIEYNRKLPFDPAYLPRLHLCTDVGNGRCVPDTAAPDTTFPTAGYGAPGRPIRS